MVCFQLSTVTKKTYKNRVTKPKTTWLRGFYFGGEGGIRTLETLLTPTRFPIVCARPATRLLRMELYTLCAVIHTTLDYYTECLSKNQPLFSIFFNFFQKTMNRQRDSCRFALPIRYDSAKENITRKGRTSYGDQNIAR